LSEAWKFSFIYHEPLTWPSSAFLARIVYANALPATINVAKLGLLLRNLIERMLCVLHGVLDVRDRTLHLARAFIILALFLEALVTSKAADGLLDPTLCFLAEFAHFESSLRESLKDVD
jgi:hypothetical protein